MSEMTNKLVRLCLIFDLNLLRDQFGQALLISSRLLRLEIMVFILELERTLLGLVVSTKTVIMITISRSTLRIVVPQRVLRDWAIIIHNCLLNEIDVAQVGM